MSDWQERITRETAPGIRVEHELRYRIAAPLIAGSAVWADLGCGNGLAAAAALEGSTPQKAVLVDVEQAVVERASQELGLAGARQLVGDLTSGGDLQAIGDALLAVEGERTVTCFEVVEHLETFVPLLQWAGELARDGAATFVISVPNDAFWSIENPHHRTVWGEGAFEELRRLLPAGHTLLRQVALSGSALLEWDRGETDYEIATRAGGERAVATHFIAAFGPRHEQIWRGAAAVQTDMLAQRQWERRRESDLAIMQTVASRHDEAIEELDRTIVRQREELRERNVWLEEWRVYIHELERELGRPLSGAAADELPERSPGTDETAAPGTAGSSKHSDSAAASTGSSDAAAPPA